MLVVHLACNFSWKKKKIYIYKIYGLCSVKNNIRTCLRYQSRAAMVARVESRNLRHFRPTTSEMIGDREHGGARPVRLFGACLGFGT